ncbi:MULTISPECIES: cation-translocating P-type ATPase [unclassified Kaistella]|uniref:cation-translocating P-type ATPase n=1 Tax=unclassified Kaistella TaxID=2762626 RepID=UPI002733749A|nr:MULTISPECIES: cation-translocating P-type ATPase [unclassified Kaistella]MDP2453131.1 cation-translocating P-type ATPase [Kaistella sp. SH11-4b]MDP2456188.1 cation-translocating P-type ATPase [Kaistella sp. SH40-3]MDP2458944.1 cation-translocating P-type ATPase [Kaistella sp. SH19-2b]
MSFHIPEHLKGLNDEEVQRSHQKFGFNQTKQIEKSSWLKLLFDILREPMLILLIIIAIIYLAVGNYGEALFMLAAIILVSGISFYQDNRSQKALEELEKLNEPLSRVIRNSKIVEIPTYEIAVGDLCITEEGKMINADGKIVHSNDFSVNESSLTGESFSVFKDNTSEDRQVYNGTSTVSGLAVFEVEHIGKETKLGKIGESISAIKDERSPLQKQIEQFLKYMAIIGIIVFLLVCAVNYYHTRNIVDSLLNGLTLAMSILPEEIPVAFTTFMALGAWKLMRDGIIIKKSNIVETLGSATVICTDKTGTITENSMHLKAVYDFKSDKVFNDNQFNEESVSELIQYAMWSSEPVPFDPMEKSLHQVYGETQKVDRRPEFEMFHEYPLDGKPPMMTHLFNNKKGERIISAKGAPEAIINVCQLSEEDQSKIRKKIDDFGKQGYRILGVAKSNFQGDDFPKKQQDIQFEFLGMVVFYDPPKKGIDEVFRKFKEAGIKIKVITGDNAQTTKSIALQAGITGISDPVSGDVISHLSEEELMKVVEQKVLFTRMFPEAKLRVINALKKNNGVVVMLGDGVNDGPALKAAHIGVAMGEKGTEIAKAAAAVILTNDDLGKLVTAIAAGRRIYTNIKKAVQYIISIHIPIILTVSLPLFLGWAFPQILTPVHVIFLELVMGPTCSIVYENEPMEKNTMTQKPRPISETFLTMRELVISIIQGLMITAGVLFIYQLTYRNGGDEDLTRSMVFTTLIFANILLSFANRSFYYTMFESFRNKNNLLIYITFATLLVLMMMLYFEPVTQFFKLTSLSVNQLLTAGSAAIISVMWFEIYKLIKRTFILNRDKNSH